MFGGEWLPGQANAMEEYFNPGLLVDEPIHAEVRRGGEDVGGEHRPRSGVGLGQ